MSVLVMAIKSSCSPRLSMTADVLSEERGEAQDIFVVMAIDLREFDGPLEQKSLEPTVELLQTDSARLIQV